MKSTGKITGRAASIPQGLTISSIFNLCATVILSAAIAYMLDRERITWHQSGYMIMILLFMTAFCGAKIAAHTIKHQRIIISFMSGLLYWGLLLCMSALFFGGQFGAVMETAFIICGGSICAVLITIPDFKVPGRKKRRGRLVS